MNKIGTFQLAVMFCGCFLGAGFLSGNEIWQFFASFGIKGLMGCILSVILIGIFCGFIIEVSIAKNTENPERVILPKKLHKSSMLFGALQALLVFTVVVIMVSGSSTLVYNMLGINRNIAGIFFALFLALLVLLGTDRIVDAFSILIPFIALFGIIIGIAVTFKSGSILPPTLNKSANKLLNNAFVSIVTYLSYSIFSSVGVFSAISKKVKSKKSLWGGVMLGTFVMIVMAVVIILAIWAVPDAMKAELPMLSSAINLGKIPGIIYAVLLYFGMFGAALSCFMALSNYFRVKFLLRKNTYHFVVILIALASFVGSIFGFGDLIGTIYPLFGYIGIVVLVSLAVNFINVKFKN